MCLELSTWYLDNKDYHNTKASDSKRHKDLKGIEKEHYRKIKYKGGQK